jgi:hypothetical protein
MPAPFVATDRQDASRGIDVLVTGALRVAVLAKPIEGSSANLDRKSTSRFWRRRNSGRGALVGMPVWKTSGKISARLAGQSWVKKLKPENGLRGA